MQYDEDNIFSYNRYFKIRLSSEKFQNSHFKPKWSFSKFFTKIAAFENLSKKVRENCENHINYPNTINLPLTTVKLINPRITLVIISMILEKMKKKN